MTMPFPASDSLQPIFFARRDDQDLDFDDQLEDFDDFRRKPPGHRPFVIILAILLLVGLGYVVMNQDMLSSIINMVSAPANRIFKPQAAAPVPQQKITRPAPLQTPPIPTYYEGQAAVVVLRGAADARLRLSKDDEGKQPGPLVKTGEVVTVLDGSFINNTWIYFVQRKSGAFGWLKEENLRPQS